MKTTTKKKQYLKYLGILTISLWIAVAALVGLQVRNVVTSKNISSSRAANTIKILEHPKRQVNLLVGELAELRIRVQSYGVDNGYFQWYQNNQDSNIDGTAIGGDKKELTIPSNQTGVFYYYCVVKTEMYETGDTFVSSNVSIVTIQEKLDGKPVISQQPQDITVYQNNTAKLSVEATGSDSLSYQWYQNTQNSTDGSNVLMGQDQKELSFVATNLGTTYYFVIVSIDSSQTASSSVVSDIVQIEVLEREGNGGGDNVDEESQDNNPNNPTTPTTGSSKDLPYIIIGVASVGLISVAIWLVVKKMR